MDITYDSSVELLTVHSLFAALEAGCLEAGAIDTLPCLGMARGEFTDFGRRWPEKLQDARFETFEAGLLQLDGLLGQLLAGSQSLQDALRLQRARDVLREGLNRS